MKDGVHVSFLINFLQVYAQEWDCRVIWSLYFQFFKEPPNCVPWWLHQFTLSSTMQEASLFSTPSPAFIFCRLKKKKRCIQFSHSSKIQILFKFPYTVNQQTVEHIQGHKTKVQKCHGLKLLKSQSLFSYHCKIMLETSIKRYLKVIHVFSSAM